MTAALFKKIAQYYVRPKEMRVVREEFSDHYKDEVEKDIRRAFELKLPRDKTLNLPPFSELPTLRMLRQQAPDTPSKTKFKNLPSASNKKALAKLISTDPKIKQLRKNIRYQAKSAKGSPNKDPSEWGLFKNLDQNNPDVKERLNEIRGLYHAQEVRKKELVDEYFEKKLGRIDYAELVNKSKHSNVRDLNTNPHSYIRNLFLSDENALNELRSKGLGNAPFSRLHMMENPRMFGGNHNYMGHIQNKTYGI